MNRPDASSTPASASRNLNENPASSIPQVHQNRVELSAREIAQNLLNNNRVRESSEMESDVLFALTEGNETSNKVCLALTQNGFLDSNTISVFQIIAQKGLTPKARSNAASQFLAATEAAHLPSLHSLKASVKFEGSKPEVGETQTRFDLAFQRSAATELFAHLAEQFGGHDAQDRVSSNPRNQSKVRNHFDFLLEHSYELHHLSAPTLSKAWRLLQTTARDEARFNESSPEVKRLALALVRRCPKEYPHLPAWLKADPEVFKTALLRASDLIEQAPETLQNNSSLNGLCAIIRGDVAIDFDTQRDSEIDATPEDPKLVTHRDRVLATARANDPEHLARLTEEDRKDSEVLLTGIRSNHTVLERVPEQLLLNEDFMLAATRENGSVLSWLPESFPQYDTFVKNALQNKGMSLQYAPAAFQSDRATVLTAVEQEGKALKYASQTLKQDRGFIREAIETNPAAILAVPELFEDQEVISWVVNRPATQLKVAFRELARYEDFMGAAVEANPDILEYADPRYDNYSILVMQALAKDGLALRHIPDSYIRQNQEVALYAMEQNEEAFQYFPA